MSQSAWIVAFLFAGFVLFLAARGRIPTYASVLWGAKQASPQSAPPGVFPKDTPTGTQHSSVTDPIGAMIDALGSGQILELPVGG